MVRFMVQVMCPHFDDAKAKVWGAALWFLSLPSFIPLSPCWGSRF